MTKAFSLQPKPKLERARTKVSGLSCKSFYLLTQVLHQIHKFFPEFRAFDDPQWPVDAFLLVVLKGSSQSQQNTTRKELDAAAAARGEPAREKRKGAAKKIVSEESVEVLAQDVSMLMIEHSKSIYIRSHITDV
jgi:hypothetical protein